MKTYKYLFLLIGGLSIIGCSDLEEEPVGLLAPEGFFQSTEDVQTAVNATYAHALNEEVWGRKLSIALMMRSDMVQFIKGSTPHRIEMDDHTITDNNEMVYDPWNRIYRGIAAANTAIAGAELVNATDDEINPVIAQAYFMRAFFYFHLVRLFGEVPYLTEPVTASTAEAQASINKTSVADVYAGIISDLQFAETHLPNTQPARSLPSKGAAKSYLALVYLTRAGTNGNDDFTLAFNKAKEVIDNKGTYDYALDSDFQNLFNADEIDASKEPIFALDYNNVEAGDNAYDQLGPMLGLRGNNRFGKANAGWSQGVPALKVYTDWSADDYRRAVSFDDEASFGDDEATFYNYTEFGTAPGSENSQAVPRPYIAKYYRFPGNFARSNVRATSHNYSMIRYAEVLLIAAEAAASTGTNTGLGLDYLNEVRERARAGGSWRSTPANAEPADLSTLTVDDVLEERRLELAFEGKRWYDIARRKIGAQVFSASGLEGEKSE
ncbi:RagB/SusD family nutrient uptake outer membrane protein, partial [Algibacter sp.]|nr:RagB/SusD family nutrient uptake outer membrane protein [Algibacter sp.]